MTAAVHYCSGREWKVLVLDLEIKLSIPWPRDFLKGLDNKTVFQSKADHPQTRHIDMLYCSCDLDLDSLTLI